MLSTHPVVVLSGVQKRKLYQSTTKEELLIERSLGTPGRHHYYCRVDSSKMKTFNGTGNVKEFITKD